WRALSFLSQLTEPATKCLIPSVHVSPLSVEPFAGHDWFRPPLVARWRLTPPTAKTTSALTVTVPAVADEPVKLHVPAVVPFVPSPGSLHPSRDVTQFDVASFLNVTVTCV